MRALWLHRSVEVVQNKIANHIFNPSHSRRHEIVQDWKNIQAEFADIIKEMDTIVESYKCLGVSNSQTADGSSSRILPGANIPKILSPKQLPRSN
jgi:hypothetical protein